MKGQAVTYYSTGQTDVTAFVSPPTLDFLQAAVGGLIEAVPAFNTIEQGGQVAPCVAFCNEEGKLEGQTLNVPATALWLAAQRRDGVSIDDVLLGQVVILTGDDEFMESL